MPEIRHLPCKLSREEYEQRTQRLCERLNKRQDIAAQKIAQNAIWYRELKETNAEIETLTKTVATGEEIREVECIEEKDLDRRVLVVRRLDTGAVVDSRPLTVEECQADLPFTRAQGERGVSYLPNPKAAATKEERPAKAVVPLAASGKKRRRPAGLDDLPPEVA
jgi:hypothetical protein